MQPPPPTPMPSAGLIIHLCIRLLLHLSDDVAAVPLLLQNSLSSSSSSSFSLLLILSILMRLAAVVVRTHTSIRTTITAAQWPSCFLLPPPSFLSSLQSLNSQRMQKFSLPQHTHTHEGCKAFLDSFIPQKHRSAPNTPAVGAFSPVGGKQLSLTASDQRYTHALVVRMSDPLSSFLISFSHSQIHFLISESSSSS